MPAQPSVPVTPAMRGGPRLFSRVGERLWLDFVNTDEVVRGARADLLRDFDALVAFLVETETLDLERGSGMRRRADSTASRSGSRNLTRCATAG